MPIASKKLNFSVHIKMNSCLGGVWGVDERGRGRGRGERETENGDMCFEAVDVLVRFSPLEVLSFPS